MQLYNNTKKFSLKIIKLWTQNMDFYTVVDGKQKVVEKFDHRSVRTIEWEMMDKTKFFPLSMLSSFTIRCALYPLTLIKTRLQIQKHNNLYTGNLLF